MAVDMNPGVENDCRERSVSDTAHQPWCTFAGVERQALAIGPWNDAGIGSGVGNHMIKEQSRIPGLFAKFYSDYWQRFAWIC